MPGGEEAPVGTPVCDETFTGTGADYRGCQFQTASGKLCMPWREGRADEKYPKEKYPELADGPHRNLCRNPGGERNFIGCFPKSAGHKAIFEKCVPDVGGQNTLLFGFKTCPDGDADSRGPVLLRLNDKTVLTLPDGKYMESGTFTVPYSGDLKSLVLATDAKDGWGICELRIDRTIWTGKVWLGAGTSRHGCTAVRKDRPSGPATAKDTSE